MSGTRTAPASVSDEVQGLRADVEQRDRQLVALQERVNALGAAQNEARAGRDRIAELTVALAAAEGAAEAARRDAAAARAAAANASANASAGSADVDAARQIADGVRRLIG